MADKKVLPDMHACKGRNTTNKTREKTGDRKFAQRRGFTSGQVFKK